MFSPSVALIRLSIKDFRGIERLELDFTGPEGKPNQLVVLAGPNGSGKTSVLEAALIVAGGYRFAVGARGPSARRIGTGDYEIVGEFRDANGKSVTSKDTSRGKAPDAPFGAPLWYFSSSRAPRLIGPLDVTVGKPGRRPSRNDENRLLNVKQQLVNEAAKARFRSGQRTLGLKFDAWMESINENWGRFYPGSGGKFLVDLADRPGEEGGAFEVFHEFRDGRRLAVDFLSSGQLEIFLFLASLVLNSDRPGLIIIDEPELHLDPQWHRLILRCLTSLQTSTQFLVATLSPEIYDAARSYERHFLVPDDDPRARGWLSSGAVESGV